MARTRHILTIALLALALISARDARAQLLAPGKLAQAHGHLEGLRSCTSCHALRQSGVQNEKCLACHDPLRNRLEEGKGYHATLGERACSSCHMEHRGREYVLVELDTARFDHGETGFALAGGHAQAECRGCHQPEFVVATDVRAFKGEHGAIDRTLLGLGTRCELCHEPDNPHTGEIAERACDDCHAEQTWKEAAGFDHNTTRYRLTGRHRRTACQKCHRPLPSRDGKKRLQFAPLEFRVCTDCHRDVHASQEVRVNVEGKACRDCHTTSDWHRLPRETVERGFDHSTTEFPLEGAHVELECETCHRGELDPDTQVRLRFKPETRRFAYPHPRADDCTSCHIDYHRDRFHETPGGVLCDNCHGEDDWQPVTYDVDRHNAESRYALEGAHLTIPCIDCHPTPERGQEAAQFKAADLECEACHEEDDPHEAQFGTARCESCHQPHSFKKVEFDHNESRYPLDGAHRDVACESCHPQEEGPGGRLFRRYKPLGTECRDCHSEMNDG